MHLRLLSDTRVVCDVHGMTVDLTTIEALVRLQLTARRLGASVQLERASPRLIAALDACGLGDLFALGSDATLPDRAPRRTPGGSHPP